MDRISGMMNTYHPGTYATEELLASKEEQFRALLECSPDAIIVISMTEPPRGLYVNRSAIELSGATTASEVQAILDDPSGFIHPDFHSVRKDRMERVKRGGIAEFTEFKMIRVDGSIVDVEMRSIPIIFENMPAIHTTIRDITERSKTQELLRNSEKLSAAGQLAAGIAHEIRNPLTAIKGFLQLMRTSPAKKEYFDIMNEELDRIELILTELLVLAKPHESKRRQVDLHPLIYQVTALLESQANLTNVRVLIHPLENACIVSCDENQIKQVFVNLIKNAIESMPDGGDVTIHLIREPKHVQIRIEDQGIGIPKDKIPRIGQPFYTTKENGTGLGLMVTEKIIDNHNGTLWIESEEGDGAVAIVRLPLELD